MLSDSKPMIHIPLVVLLAWIAAAAGTDSTRAGGPKSVVYLKSAPDGSDGQAPAPSILPVADAEASHANSIPARLNPVDPLPYSTWHLEGKPLWNWDSPYALGTGLWARSYAENAMQGHVDPDRSRRNWIFGLR